MYLCIPLMILLLFKKLFLNIIFSGWRRQCVHFAGRLARNVLQTDTGWAHDARVRWRGRLRYRMLIYWSMFSDHLISDWLISDLMLFDHLDLLVRRGGSLRYVCLCRSLITYSLISNHLGARIRRRGRLHYHMLQLISWSLIADLQSLFSNHLDHLLSNLWLLVLGSLITCSPTVDHMFSAHLFTNLWSLIPSQITSLTDLLSFAVGYLTPFPSVQVKNITALLYITRNGRNMD